MNEKGKRRAERRKLRQQQEREKSSRQAGIVFDPGNESVDSEENVDSRFKFLRVKPGVIIEPKKELPIYDQLLNRYADTQAKSIPEADPTQIQLRRTLKPRE